MADPHAHDHDHDHAHDAHGHEPEHAHAPGDHVDEHGMHIHDVNHYVRIWAMLVVLFFISVTGPILGIKILTLITAFGVAVVKASMVVKYFMHLDVEKRFVHYFLATSLVFMFLFFAGVAPDVMNHRGTRWENLSAQHTVEEGLAHPPVEEGEGHEGRAEHAEH